jgi:putative effector of murein hydrolase
VWTGAVLGVISANELAQVFKAGKIATQVLAEKTALTSSNEMIGVSFGMWASLFAFAAIATSVFGQGLSVSAFVREFMPRLREDFILIAFFGFCLACICVIGNFFVFFN